MEESEVLSQSLMQRTVRCVLSYSVVGLIGAVVLLASAIAQQNPPVPPAPPAPQGWTVVSPNNATFSRFANIVCDGTANAGGVPFAAGISVNVGGTWVVQNSVTGVSVAQGNSGVWGATVSPPNGGFAAGWAFAFVRPLGWPGQANGPLFTIQ